MYEGSTAILKMLHVYLEGEPMDENEYRCRITEYDPEREYMYMTLEEGDLTGISLDAEYDCRRKMSAARVLSESGISTKKGAGSSFLWKTDFIKII